MGYQSQAGHVGLKIQAAKGTYANPGSTVLPGVFMRTRSGAMGGDRDMLIPDPEIGGNRDVPDAKLGPIKFAGSYDFYARMESLATLILAAFGHNPTKASYVVDGTGGTYTLTYGGQTTGTIAFNATPATVKTALEALSTVAVGDVSVTGGVGASGGGPPYIVTFLNTGAIGANATALTADDTLVTGGGSSVVVTMSGVMTSGDASAGFLHSIDCLDSGSLPWVSVEEQIADGYEVFKYTDCKVNEFHLEANANGYLMGTAGLIGLRQAETTPTALDDQVWDTSPLMVGTEITVAWGGVTLPAKEFKFDLKNNIEDNDFRLGSLFLGDLVEKRREITMGVKIRPQDNALWKTAMWGSPVATVPGGESFKDDVVISIDTYEDIPGATAGVKYTLDINVGQAVIKPFTASPSGDDVIEHDIEIQAVRPDPADPILTADIRNSYETVV